MENVFFPFLVLKFCTGGIQTSSSIETSLFSFSFSSWSPTSWTCFNGLSLPLMMPAVGGLFSLPSLPSRPRFMIGTTGAGAGGDGDFLSTVWADVGPFNLRSSRLLAAVELPFRGESSTPSINAFWSIDATLGSSGAGDLTSSRPTGIWGNEGVRDSFLSAAMTFDTSLEACPWSSSLDVGLVGVGGSEIGFLFGMVPVTADPAVCPFCP